MRITASPFKTRRRKSPRELFRSRSLARRRKRRRSALLLMISPTAGLSKGDLVPTGPLESVI